MSGLVISFQLSITGFGSYYHKGAGREPVGGNYSLPGEDSGRMLLSLLNDPADGSRKSDRESRVGSEK